LVVEQMLNDTYSPAEFCRRYSIASGQFHTSEKQYADGKLDLEPPQEAELQARVRELEKMLSIVTLEGGKNQFITENRIFMQTVKTGCELMKLHRGTHYYKPNKKTSN
jgi:hypothetical protein